jgi:hypothetical protein
VKLTIHLHLVQRSRMVVIPQYVGFREAHILLTRHEY